MRRPAIGLLSVLITACSRHAAGPAPPGLTPAEAAFQTQLQEQLRTAKPGVVIAIVAGTHPLDHTLTLRADGVTIRGAGKDLTILSLRSVAADTAGIKVSGRDLGIENLAIEDAGGDALVIEGGANVVVRGVRAAWSAAPAAARSPRGIVADGSQMVLIEESDAFSAPGAGIYIAQSRSAVVRRCHVEQDGIGISIINTVGAEVHDNTVTGNATGILISGVPGASQSGHAVRVFNNLVYKNNLGAAAAPDATAAGVPSGSGVAVHAGGDVEIFGNDINDNQTANVWIAAQAGGIFIHDNHFSAGGTAPSTPELRSLKAALFGPAGRLPDIVWDGQPPGEQRLCVQNGNAVVLNTDAAHRHQHPDTAVQGLRCELPPLPAAGAGGGR